MSGEPHEIVIIKRVSAGHEDEHHGGVWKIAFADFMTAMMAFFLVMWLISANDKTKAVIARYFNPVQLVDSTPQPRGLEDAKKDAPSVVPKSGSPAESKDKGEAKEKGDGKIADLKSTSGKTDEKPNGKADHTEADLLKDPYAVLSEIAARSEKQVTLAQAKAVGEGASGGAGAVGRKGGEAYRDPFEPLPPSAGGTLDPFAPKVADEFTPASPAGPPVPPSSSPPTAQGAAPAEAPPASGSLPPALPIAAKLEAALSQGAGPAAALPRLEVKQTGEGTLIDLTDGFDFAMFTSASAEPSPRMVAVMARIGQLLKDEKGQITIRGFTDNRPFKSDTYDNWRLSAARAHMAHYMLVRGGLDESRFDRIEGYADRQPKNPKNPGAPENRRIEILVRRPAP